MRPMDLKPLIAVLALAVTGLAIGFTAGTLDLGDGGSIVAGAIGVAVIIAASSVLLTSQRTVDQVERRRDERSDEP